MLGLGIMLLEGALLAAFSLEGWTLSTPLALAMYLGLEKGFNSGGAALAGLILPLEWLVAGVPGAYSLSAVLVFSLMCLLRSQVQSGWGVARGVIVLLGGLLHGAILTLIFFLVRNVETNLAAAVGWKMWSAALTAAIVTIVIGKGFARLERIVDPRKGRRRLEF